MAVAVALLVVGYVKFLVVVADCVFANMRDKTDNPQSATLHELASGLLQA